MIRCRCSRSTLMDNGPGLDQEDESHEAYHHQQYGMLQPVFEIACCHLTTNQSGEESFDHCHVQKYRGNFVQGETYEVEPHSSNGSAAAEVGVGQLFEEA